MKIAIHIEKDKKVSWNTRWMDICDKQGFNYIGINCYSPSIIQELKDKKVTHLMWAISHFYFKDLLVARSILNSAEKMGILTFPNFNTSWHFDDKISQKYLLESIDADVVKSWIFFEKKEALKFTMNTEYPIVAKLRRGAGSSNVQLLHNHNEGKKYVKIMFRNGHNPVPSYTSFPITGIINASKYEIGSLIKKISRLPKNIVKRKKNASLFPKEKGYVFFQQFLPGNTDDMRITIVGNRAWGFYRGVRKNDFRASGSGNIIYDKVVPLEVVRKSFDYTRKLGTQSLAFDYVKDQNGIYRIVEISYGFVGDVIYKTNGYWDTSLSFHEGNYMPEECILMDFIKR